MRVAAGLVRRDLRIAGRIGGAGGLGLVFFLMVVAIVPFGLGPDLNLLSRIGPAILWIAGLLATLIGLDRLFQADEEDGSLDLMRLSPAPLEIVVLAKVAAHWLTTGLPLALTALALAIGTPGLAFCGAIGAALAATIRRGGLVIAVLVVPLCVPILIFGVAASDPTGAARDGALAILAALTLAAAAIGTVGAAAALRSG
jgi:heme exporter protein B